MKTEYVYPHQEITQGYANEPINRGLTLRDYFAGQALMGLCACQDYPLTNIGEESYKIADQMLSERRTIPFTAAQEQEDSNV